MQGWAAARAHLLMGADHVLHFPTPQWHIRLEMQNQPWWEYLHHSWPTWPINAFCVALFRKPTYFCILIHGWPQALSGQSFTLGKGEKRWRPVVRKAGPATSPLLTGSGGWKVLKEPALRDLRMGLMTASESPTDVSFLSLLGFNYMTQSFRTHLCLTCPLWEAWPTSPPTP